jgi:hypothetical protein
VDDAVRRLDADGRQFRPGSAVEQPGAVAEQDRDKVQPQLVDDPSGQALPGDVGSAEDSDVHAAGRRPGVVERGSQLP